MKHIPPTATYTLSLHDALPILEKNLKPNCGRIAIRSGRSSAAWTDWNSNSAAPRRPFWRASAVTSLRTKTIASARCCWPDRKSTRLNSSHSQNSYAVFCVKKKTGAVCAGRSGRRHHSECQGEEVRRAGDGALALSLAALAADYTTWQDDGGSAVSMQYSAL